MLEEDYKKMMEERQPGLIASKVILLNYINANLLESEKEFAKAVLEFSHSPQNIVKNIHLFEKYRDLVEMHTFEKWQRATGFNYLEGIGLSKGCYDKKGKIKESLIEDILNNESRLSTKNGYAFMLKEQATELLSAKKTVLGTSFLSFESDKYGDHGIIYRRLCKANANNQDHLVVVETRIYENSTKVVSDVKFLINGKMESTYYAARMDSVGFMDERFLNKFGIDYDIPKDIEKEARQEYDHDNYYPSSKHTTAPRKVQSNNHLHVIDEDFEFTKAILDYYKTLVPGDSFGFASIKAFKTKMNAKAIDFYHEPNESKQIYHEHQQTKIEHGYKYKGVIPIQQILVKLDEELSIDHSKEFEIDQKTYDFIDHGRDPKQDFEMTRDSIVRMEHYNKTGELVLGGL